MVIYLIPTLPRASCNIFHTHNLPQFEVAILQNYRELFVQFLDVSMPEKHPK